MLLCILSAVLQPLASQIQILQNGLLHPNCQHSSTINCAKNIYLKERRGILQMGSTTNSNVSPQDSLGGNHTFLFSGHFQQCIPFFHPAKQSSLCIFSAKVAFHNSHLLQYPISFLLASFLSLLPLIIQFLVKYSRPKYSNVSSKALFQIR